MRTRDRTPLGAFEIAHAVRPRLGEHVSGDAVWTADAGDEIRVAVVDGLGHGPAAALVARAAVELVSEASWNDLSELMLECDRGLRSTRGAALALLRVRATGWAEHCGIGNIALVFERRGSRGAFARPGIVGARPRTIVVDRFPFEPGDTVVMHSDGISQRLVADRVDGESIDEQASRLILQCGKDHDDATVAIVRRRARD